jgi:phosphoglycolate phosphatase
VSCDALLFDLDGTLLDTLEDLAGSMNRVLADLGCPAHSVDAYRYFVGEGIVNLVRRALPADRRAEAVVEDGIARMRTAYAEHWADHTHVYDGVADMLDALAARGLPMAVLSNKPHDFTVRCVERFLDRWTFAAVQGVAPDVPPKPDPTGARGIAERLGVAPRRFLYLGDTGTDMRTAVAAGMFPLGVLWGFRPAAELTAAGARALAPTPADILALLRSTPPAPE